MNRYVGMFCIVVASLAARTTVQAQVVFDIQINYEGPNEFQSLFTSAEETWERILPQWADGRNDAGNAVVNSLVIDAGVGFIDGSGDSNGNTLARAGVTGRRNDGSFVLATSGIMQFEEVDIPLLTGLGSFEDVILHEMGHVLGIGTLWTDNGLYFNGSGEYTGANALREYQLEFDPSATFVPVELDGGLGTANGHWDEGNQLVVDPNNNNFGKTRSQALMTGFISQDMFISNTTGGALQDLGFVVDFNAIQARAIPEPTSMAILAGVSLVGLVRRRRS